MPKVGYVEINKSTMMLPENKLRKDDNGVVTIIVVELKAEATAAFPTNEPDLVAIKLFCKAAKIQGNSLRH